MLIASLTLIGLCFLFLATFLVTKSERRSDEHEFDLRVGDARDILAGLAGQKVELRLLDQTVFGTVGNLHGDWVVMHDARIHHEDGISQPFCPVDIRLAHVRLILEKRKTA